jgi:hypothetical protein
VVPLAFPFWFLFLARGCKFGALVRPLQRVIGNKKQPASRRGEFDFLLN